jgi:hypothetical protein
MVAPAGMMDFYSKEALENRPAVNLFIHRPGRATAQFVETLMSDDQQVVRTFRRIPSSEQAAFSRHFSQLPGLESGPLIGGIGKVLFYQETFNLLLLFEASGRFLGSYSDIASPLTRRPDGYHLTDWFLDVWIPYFGGLNILDEDEFEAAISADLLQPDEILTARQTLERLVQEYAAGVYPNSYLS